jgi:ABC-2 type transport system permease protein
VRNLAEPALLVHRESVAALPYPRTRRTIKWHLAQFTRVVRVQLLEFRTAWIYLIVFGCLIPLGLIFLLSRMGGALTREWAIFVLGGNLVTSIVYGPVTGMIGKIGWGREQRTFDYWAALPLPKLAWILATVTVYLLLALPSVVIIFGVGALSLGIPFSAGLALLPLIPLGTLSMVGLGAFLGLLAPNGQTANLFGNAMVGVVTFLSPTLLPLAQMPTVMQWIARVLPTTYAADAFRLALTGDFGRPFLVDVGILGLSSLVFLWVLARRLDFRG